MGKYRLICMAFDGDYVTESDRFTRDGFDSVEAAWEHDDDMGSRWVMWPFHFVTTASGKTVVDTPDLLPELKGKRVDTVKRLFKRVSVMPEAQGVNSEVYSAIVSNVLAEA